MKYLENNKYNHKKASNQIKDPNHLKAITNNHHPPKNKEKSNNYIQSIIQRINIINHI